MTAVHAHWAFWSKNAGDDQDYRVLLCSNGKPEQFTALVHAENPGTPRTEESGRPGSLPWVAFGSRHDGRENHCSIAVMDWTDDLDWTNRRITATTWVTVPFDELGSRGAEYADLYRAVLSASLRDREQAGLDLPDARAAARVSPPGEVPEASAPTPHWAAGVAALLLEDRVVVTGAGHVGVAERIAAIDAVARMLPYGYRADLTACTWTPVPEQVCQRLCFADYLGDGLARVPWEGRVPQPSGPDARRYLELLTGHLDAGKGAGVLAWLGANAKSRPFSEPGRALEVLEALNLPELVVAEVRSGQGKAERVLKALHRSGLDAFDTEARRTVFTFLFARHDPALYPGMVRHTCGELHEAAVSALHGALVPAAPGRASAASEATAIAETFVPPLWDDARAADGFVAALLGVPRDRDVPYALVSMWVERFAAAREQDWPQVTGALLHTPRVGLAAVRCCAHERPDELPRLVGMLARAGSAPWLTVLRWATDAPDQGAASARTLAQAVEQCAGVAVQAYRLAAWRRSFDALPVPLWQEWLRIGADERRREYAELADEVGDFDPAHNETTTPRGAARLGLLRCLYGRTFSVPTTANAGEYVRELADACRMLPQGAAHHHGDPAVGMLQGVIQAYGSRPDSGRLTVAVLLAAVDRADDLGTDTCRVLADEALDATGGLRPAVRDALADDDGKSWRRLLDGIPELALTVRLSQLEHDARDGKPAAELAAHWAWLLFRAGAGLDEKRVHRALRSWHLLSREGVAYELLLGVRSGLVEHGWRPEQANDWLVRTVRAVVTDNWLGRPVADGLRRALTKRREAVRAEEKQLTRMIGDSQAAAWTNRNRSDAGPPNGPGGSAAGSFAAPPPPDRPPVPGRPAGADPARRTPGTARFTPFRTSSGPRSGPRRPDAEWPPGPWYRRRRPLVAVGVGLAVLLAALSLYVAGVFDSSGSPGPTSTTVSPSGAPQPKTTPASPVSSRSDGNGTPRDEQPPSGGATSVGASGRPTPSATPPITQAATPLPSSLGGALPGLIVVLIAVGAVAAAVYRRPRWAGRLTMCVRRDAGSGYQVAGVMVRGPLGRPIVHGRDDEPGVLRLPQTTARVRVSARRAWRNPGRVDLLVRVRLSDSGRWDTVRCPAGGRRMVLGLDMRHDPTPAPPAPPRPEVPPPAGPAYPYPNPTVPGPVVPDAPTIVQPFPPRSPIPDQPTLVAPPPQPSDRHTGGFFSAGEFSGGPETGGPRPWPPT